MSEVNSHAPSLENSHAFMGNRLLSALPANKVQNLSSELRPFLFHTGTILFEPGSESDFVYFPKSGVISLVLASTIGIDVEVGLVGCEGVVSAADALVGHPNLTRAQVQIAGSGWRLSSSVLRDEFPHNLEFQRILLGYQRTLTGMTAQNTLCNRLHSIEQRLAKWLLLAQDRVASPELGFTHEFLANMLGTRRAAVTLAAQSMREAGLIDYRRGSVMILDRARLEKVACECYSTLKAQYDESP